MIEVALNPSQGLYDVENSCQSFWILKARIDLPFFARIDVETLEKEDKIPHPSSPKRRE